MICTGTGTSTSTVLAGTTTVHTSTSSTSTTIPEYHVPCCCMYNNRKMKHGDYWLVKGCLEDTHSKYCETIMMFYDIQYPGFAITIITTHNANNDIQQ